MDRIYDLSIHIGRPTNGDIEALCFHRHINQYGSGNLDSLHRLVELILSTDLVVDLLIEC